MAGTGRKPDNYLVWAILSTIFCCLPFGIVAIVFSAQVDGAWESGDHARAQSLSQKAKTWTMVSAGLGLAVILVYVLFVVVFAASAQGM